VLSPRRVYFVVLVKVRHPPPPSFPHAIVAICCTVSKAPFDPKSVRGVDKVHPRHSCNQAKYKNTVRPSVTLQVAVPAGVGYYILSLQPDEGPNSDFFTAGCDSTVDPFSAPCITSYTA